MTVTAVILTLIAFTLAMTTAVTAGILIALFIISPRDDNPDTKQT